MYETKRDCLTGEVKRNSVPVLSSKVHCYTLYGHSGVGVVHMENTFHLPLPRLTLFHHKGLSL